MPNFTRANRDKEWKSAFAVIKRAVEEAKIQLSTSESAFLERCHFRDADGNDVDLELKLTRNEVVSVAEPIIMQSVKICKNVLKQRNLSFSAIEKVILVGGPTKAPYFREILKDQLKINLDFSVDPLTVVARGAAVFAGTQRIEGNLAPKAVAGQYDLNLKYDPVGIEEDPIVRGEVKSVSGVQTEGFTIEFINDKTRWHSGKVTLKGDGRFKVSLFAEKGFQNTFSIELHDSKGNKQVSVPDSLSYTIGLAISDQPVLNPISVALATGGTKVKIKRGESLPAKSKDTLHTAHTVKKGESGSVLNVPVIEGEEELADRNRLLGTLQIRGEKITRDLPAGSEIEVTLIIDKSRMLRAKAYVPMLDEEFETIINFNRLTKSVAELQKEYDNELKRLAELNDQAADADEKSAQEMLAQIESDDTLADLLENAKGDPDLANKADKQIVALKVKLDKASDILKWPALIAEANKALENCNQIIEQHGNDDQQEKANELRDQVDELIEQKRSEPLRKKIELINDLYREILFALPGFWLGFYNDLVADKRKMSDQNMAERLINQGKQHIDKGNVQGLRNVVVQLLGLLPQEEQEAVQRAHGSGVV